MAPALSTGVRLMRHGEYPPARGTCVSLGDHRYLYTTGYVPSLGRYPHGHVPGATDARWKDTVDVRPCEVVESHRRGR
ncbi:hypothetical protein ACFXPE_25100 [Streptomyces scopuliridis]|uniref:hypothetical protein n=1 Tax=Streptomyces scopuliridis TaxID=452529 RepID=UPI0036A41B19